MTTLSSSLSSDDEKLGFKETTPVSNRVKKNQRKEYENEKSHKENFAIGTSKNDNSKKKSKNQNHHKRSKSNSSRKIHISQNIDEPPKINNTSKLPNSNNNSTKVTPEKNKNYQFIISSP